MDKPIIYAQIGWQADLTSTCDINTNTILHPPPTLELFTQQYQYYKNSPLPEQFRQLQAFQYLSIGQLGFGLGLELIALWLVWRDYLQTLPAKLPARLHLVCIEAQPLTKQDLSLVFDLLMLQPNLTLDLASIRQQLLAQYPPAIPGVHRMIFADDHFSVDLWLGSPRQCLEQLYNTRPFHTWQLYTKIDHNIQPEIFSQLLRLSDEKTIFMGSNTLLVTQLTQTQNRDSPPIKSTSKPFDRHIKNTVIIGAGIAGLSVANAFIQRGYSVTLIDKPVTPSGIAEHGSKNPRAMLVPKIVSIKLVAHNLHGLGVLSTQRWWQVWADDVVKQTGALWLITGVQARDGQKHIGYPADYYQLLDQNQASQKAGVALNSSALYIPSGCVLNPHAMRQKIVQSSQVNIIEADIQRLNPIHVGSQTQWQLLNANGEVVITAEHVVVAAALHSQQLVSGLPYLRAIRGQLSWITSTFNNLPQVPLCYGGYAAHIEMSPHNTENNQSILSSVSHVHASVEKPISALMLGASFVRDDTSIAVRNEEHLHNQSLLNDVAPDLATALPAIDTWEGRASIRAQALDYFPLVGEMPHMSNVWVCTGFGSKGFAFAPLCAELLLAQIAGEVWPVTKKLGQQCLASRVVQR